MKQINIWYPGAGAAIAYEGPVESPNRYDPAKRREINTLNEFQEYLKRNINPDKKLKIVVDKNYSNVSQLEQVVRRFAKKVLLEEVDFSSVKTHVPIRPLG